MVSNRVIQSYVSRSDDDDSIDELVETISMFIPALVRDF